MIPNRLESIRKIVAKLGPARDMKTCYEADPTGYASYFHLPLLLQPALSSHGLVRRQRKKHTHRLNLRLDRVAPYQKRNFNAN